MKIARNLLLTFLLASSLFAPACNDDPDCNCGDVLEFFDIEGLAVANFRTLPNSNVNLQQLFDGEAVEWEDYSFFGEFAVSFYGMAPQKEEPSFWTGWSFINEAWACSCIPDGFSGSEETLEDFEIITLTDFDADHPAGASMVAILDIRTSKEGDLSEITDLDDFLVNNREFVDFVSFNLFLQQAPTVGDSHQFSIRISLTNGEVYSAEGNTVELIR